MQSSPYPARVMAAKPITAPKVSPKSPNFVFASDVPKAKPGSSALARAMASEERANVPKLRSKKI